MLGVIPIVMALWLNTGVLVESLTKIEDIKLSNVKSFDNCIRYVNDMSLECEILVNSIGSDSIDILIPSFSFFDTNSTDGFLLRDLSQIMYNTGIRGFDIEYLDGRLFRYLATPIVYTKYYLNKFKTQANEEA